MRKNIKNDNAINIPNSELSEKKKPKSIAKNVVKKTSQTGKKGIEVASGVLSQTASGGKALASGLAKSAKELSEKSKVDSYNRRMKKYNPLFLQEYESEGFFVPNLICIVDDAVRRDIDVCKGAIGWREKKGGMEVLFLYDEFVKDCGLTFVPVALCDEVYYIDAYDKNRYIKIDNLFEQSHNEKVSELENIAYSLGAKSCTIHFEEVEIRREKKKKTANASEGTSVGVTAVTANESCSFESKRDRLQTRSSKSETNFKGNDTIVKPNLKWFAHDAGVINLIEYRCKGGNEITSKTLEINGKTLVTVSKKAARSIDTAVSQIDASYAGSIEQESVKESSTKIVYHLEF